MMNLKLSAASRAKLKRYETGGVMATNSRGRRYLKLLPIGEPALKAYRCPAGKWTIGWGDTIGVYEGLEVTRAQAEARLTKRVAEWCRDINAMLAGAATNQNQFDALFLISYNIGVDGLRKSTLLKKHKAGDFLGAANQFRLWNKGRVGGKLVELAGLTERRGEERTLYLKPCAGGRTMPGEDEVDASEFDQNLSRNAVVAPPKSMGASTTIAGAVGAGVPALGAAFEGGKAVLGDGSEEAVQTTTVPLTVDAIQEAQDGTIQIQQQAEGAGYFPTIALVLGIIVMLLSAYLIYKRVKERNEGVH